MTSDIAISARPKALGRQVDWHIPGFPRRPFVSAANPAAGVVQLAEESAWQSIA